jgi:hypothetical protein
MSRRCLGSSPLLLAVCLVFAPHAANAADPKTWQYFAKTDPGNSASLSYGVPETDDRQVGVACDSAKQSVLTFGADIGKTAKAGAPSELRFSGGGFERTAKGTIVIPAEEGIAGVRLELPNDDPLWQALLEKDELDYLVPGYRASTLDLTSGRDKIRAYIDACRGSGQAAASAQADAKGGGSAEKDAFESAKELGTKDAWEAFLANYPSGFHADLARAYLKKLSGGDTAAASVTPLVDAQALGPVAASISKVPDRKSLAEIPYPERRDCGDRANLKSQRYDTPAKIRFVHYSGPSRDVHWLDYKGIAQNYITIKSGQQTSVETFLSHPWMITDSSGDCIEIVLPRPGTSVVVFGEPSKSTSSKNDDDDPKPSVKKCRKGYTVVGGRCIKKQDAATSCGPGFRLKGNKCVPGYKPPPPQAQRPSWQIEAIKKGCKPGMGWNAAEGCHEND